MERRIYSLQGYARALKRSTRRAQEDHLDRQRFPGGDAGDRLDYGVRDGDRSGSGRYIPGSRDYRDDVREDRDQSAER